VAYCPQYIKPSPEFDQLVASGNYKPQVNNDFNRILKQQIEILKNCYPEKYQWYLKTQKEKATE